MSVESAWDAELASAGEVLESEHQAYIQQARVLAQRVVRLEAENAALRRIIHEGTGWHVGSFKVDL